MTVPWAQIINIIKFTFIFNHFFNSLSRSRYLSFFSLSFNFTQCSAGTTKSTILIVFVVLVHYNKIWLSGRDEVIRLYVKTLLKFLGFILQDSCWVEHVRIICLVKFYFLAQFPMDHLAHSMVSYSYSLSVLICCIGLWCNWSFRFYHHISCIYCFVASYLFLLWHDWFFLLLFVLLLKEIQFLT